MKRCFISILLTLRQSSILEEIERTEKSSRVRRILRELDSIRRNTQDFCRNFDDQPGLFEDNNENLQTCLSL